MTTIDDTDDEELYERGGDFPPSVFLSPQKKLFGLRDYLPDLGADRRVGGCKALRAATQTNNHD
jgi:hypothetical protein